MNPQLSRLENSRSLQESSSSVEATSALNEIVALQGQHINVFGGNLIELMLSGIAIDGMREPSNAHALSQTEPLHIRKMNTSEASLRAQTNWGKAFSAVRQLVKGAFKDCLVIKDSYYIEMLDVRHEYIGVQKDYFEAWKKIPLKEDGSNKNYFQFLESYRRPLVMSDVSADRESLKIQDNHRYVTDSDNRIINVPFLLGQSWVFTGKTNELHLAASVHHFNPKESFRHFGLVLMRGKIVLSPEHHYKTLFSANSPPIELIFVSDKNQNIYAGLKIRKVFHHSSFLAGQPVSMAGALKVSSSGELLALDNYSGHYQPTADHCYQFLLQLRLEGVDLGSLHFDFWNQTLQLAFQGRAVDWLGQYAQGDFDLCR